MSLAFDRQFSLADPGPDGRHPYINVGGAFIGWGVPLLERTSDGGWKPRDAAAIETLLSCGYGAPFRLDWRYEQLGHVAKALGDGNLVLASLSLLHAQLPPLSSEANARAMARADGLLAKDYNPGMSPPFFVFYGLNRTDGGFGYFAVNPWTGDVWDLWSCRRLPTPALRNSQAAIRRRYTPNELKQYNRLAAIRPECT